MRAISVFGIVLLCSILTGQAWGQLCSASATGLAFGNYQPLGGPTVTTTATLTVTCNPPGSVSVAVLYTIRLSTGTGGSFTPRSMGGPSVRLNYQVYTDSGYTQIWGDGTSGTSTVSDGYLLGLVLPITRTYPAYGRITAGTSAMVGSYTDTITMTVSY